jgi:hypothetical protein
MIPLGTDYLIVLNDRQLRNAFIAESNVRRASTARSIDCARLRNLFRRLCARLLILSAPSRQVRRSF